MLARTAAGDAAVVPSHTHCVFFIRWSMLDASHFQAQHIAHIAPAARRLSPIWILEACLRLEVSRSH